MSQPSCRHTAHPRTPPRAGDGRSGACGRAVSAPNALRAGPATDPVDVSAPCETARPGWGGPPPGQLERDVVAGAAQRPRVTRRRQPRAGRAAHRDDAVCGDLKRPGASRHRRSPSRPTQPAGDSDLVTLVDVAELHPPATPAVSPRRGHGHPTRRRRLECARRARPAAARGGPLGRLRSSAPQARRPVIVTGRWRALQRLSGTRTSSASTREDLSRQVMAAATARSTKSRSRHGGRAKHGPVDLAGPNSPLTSPTRPPGRETSPHGRTPSTPRRTDRP